SMLRGGTLDLFDPAIHAAYFAQLYGLSDHDTKEVQRHRAALAFERVTEDYSIIDDGWSGPLAIAWDDRARRAIDALERFGPSRDRLRELGRVTVNVTKKDLAAWLGSGRAHAIGDGLANVLVDSSAYDRRFGLMPERVGAIAPADSVL
ncbi:MAG: hypothetical protein ACRELB_03175, partial [Polyangiaceae bacterium]